MKGSKPKGRGRKKLSPDPPRFLQNAPVQLLADMTKAAAPLTDDDLNELESFCKSILIEEVSFKDWEKTHNLLDLEVPVWISAQDAAEGSNITVNFSRSRKNSPKNGMLKERVQLNVAVPKGSTHGARVVYPGQGDVQGASQGDLVLVIYIRKSL